MGFCCLPVMTTIFDTNRAACRALNKLPMEKAETRLVVFFGLLESI
jgi:hypothetical protein